MVGEARGNARNCAGGIRTRDTPEERGKREEDPRESGVKNLEPNSEKKVR